MDSKKKIKNKIRTFNKIYKEMQHEIKTVLKKSGHVSFDVTDIKVINTFSEEMDKYVSLYDTKDAELLKKVKLLNQFFCNKPQLSGFNKETVWKYLQVMYSLASEEKKELTVKQEPLDMTKLGSLVSGLIDDKSSGFGNLIADISQKLEGKIGSGQVDQTQLLQDLLAGNLESCGINFGDIISQATDSLKQKVDAGEIDIEKMKGAADSLKSSLNIQI